MILAFVNFAFAQDEPDYLRFEVEAGSVISLKKLSSRGCLFKEDVNVQYSFDKKNWNHLTQNKVSIENDCVVYFKGINKNFYEWNEKEQIVYSASFYVSKPFKCSGNIMTLIDETGSSTILSDKYTFAYLFSGCPIVSAPKLPATVLSDSCYTDMFSNCPELTTPPKLPATTLSKNCYTSMFYYCNKLSIAPELPATSLAEGCYRNMFSLCYNLSIAPELPATSLADGCYKDMFLGCKSLLEAPDLPATTLAKECYFGMFNLCSNLTIAPKLPATKMTMSCYENMFSHCENLLIAPELPATILAERCYESMFAVCKSLKTTPTLPATELKSACYAQMFNGCDNLEKASPILFETMDKYAEFSSFSDCGDMFSGCKKLKYISVRFNFWQFIGQTNQYNYYETKYATKDWVKNVASSGTFVCPNKLSKKYGETYIPKGWTVKTLDELSTHNLTISQSAKECIKYISETMEIETGTKVSFGVQQKGYSISEVKVIGDSQYSIATTKEGNDYSFTMPNEDVTICVTGVPIDYTITTDTYSSVDKATANIGDKISVTISDRPGYDVSATYNGNLLTITDKIAEFTMPAANVEVKTKYEEHKYNVTTDKFVVVDKTKATLNDNVSFSIKDRTNEGYKLAHILVNDIEFIGTELAMKDYMQDVTITTVYSKIAYIITTDCYSTVNNNTALVGDKIIVSFADRIGYDLISATYNNNPLTINEQTAYFSMPAANVEIITTFAEHEYQINVEGAITANKSKATINDKVTFNVKDRNNDGYQLEKVLVNNKEISISNYIGSFEMKDYMSDVTIKAEYYSFLCFEVEAETTISLKKFGNANPNIQYSFDGKTWIDFTKLTVEESCSIFFKGINPNGFCTSDKDYSSFEVSKEFKCSGNVMSLIDGEGKTETIPCEYCFYNLFESCPLTTAPKLPATTLKGHCYEQMFYSCKSLIETPKLPAKKIAEECYKLMFCGCLNLKNAPQLPATTLAKYCYYGMFWSCFSLIYAPQLPATILEDGCYAYMFYRCSKLVKAPELPATSLVNNCYCCMFAGCENLQYIAVSFKSWNEQNISSFSSLWVEQVNTQGTFVCPSSLPQIFGYSFIPKGWKVNHPTGYIPYFIINNEYSQTNKNIYYEGEAVNVTFAKRDGYFLKSATISGIAIPISNYESTFTMPAASVEIETIYSPIEYTISCTDGIISIDKLKATINDVVSFSVADRTKEDYVLERVLVNGVKINVTNFVGSFKMEDFLSNITIKAEYYKKVYSIGADYYSTTDKISANYGDIISVTFTKRDGYTLTSATYNGTALSISDYKASFTMPAANVEIKTVYTPIDYSITADVFAQVDKTTANINENVNVTFTKRNGYTLTSATYNGSALSINDYKASFTMPAANVEIKTVYTPTAYTISHDNYSATNKASASIGDDVNVTFTKRNGYTLTSATYNGTALSINDYKASFAMPAANVEIKTVYTPMVYTITADDFARIDKTTANINDNVNVTFTKRNGYTLTSATYNGTALNINDYKASFSMPAANVEIKTVYTPITYTVSCSDGNITADKTKVTVEDKVNFTATDRTSEGYKLDKVLVNSKEIAVQDYKGTFDMMNYLQDVVISAEYSKIAYTISTDEFSQVNKSSATVGESVTVTFKQRNDYDLMSATCNGNALEIKNYKSAFTMPAQNVEITSVYVEKEYEIAKPSENVEISQPTAKAGDEISISVTIKDGYTAHLYVNGVEVTLNGNLANYIMPSGKIEIKVEYVADPKTPVSELSASTCTVDVFPNPAKSADEITIKISGSLDAKTSKILIYNSVGSIVKQIDNVTDYNRITLKSGIYTGVLITRNGKKSFRIVVN